ncbi:ABC transporter substrate-binding protein/permease [Enterococcus timonensis]|uniref:ABC transporter substrate-binding protein/permease n=1 Tax=Enterococcus timonensis TaxID=1852364 RepID=UPI0008D9DA82|nr:ABC transporter substrate-binding protein/permease [Enterococcus timonensis]
MRKKSFIFLLFTLVVGVILPLTSLNGTHVSAAENNDEFRVGLEAAYAPFNWTQKTAENGGVQISGEPDFANGYDVQIAQKIADALDKKLVIVKSSWDGLVPSLTSKKIDAIIAGMSPTAEREKEIDFSDSYWTSDLIVVVEADGPYASATSLDDFADAKITAQLNTFHYSVIDQISNVKKQTAMEDFNTMRVALASGVIDGYVAERPEGVTVEAKDAQYKMIEFPDGAGFVTNPEDTQISVGLRKNDPNLATINQVIAGISENDQKALMDQMIADQPGQEAEATEDSTGQETKNRNTFVAILQDNWQMLLRGTGYTVLIAMVGTVVGLLIGLLIGVFRSAPTPDNGFRRFFHKLFEKILIVYIEVFRGTPMMVQAMVIYYGLAQFAGIDLNRIIAALIIVSINTGAYMSEIVRGGIFSIDEGQFEGAEAIGMTHGQSMRKVIMPQVIRNILPVTGNEFVINIKDTSVLSVISVSELFFAGRTITGFNLNFYETFLIISAIYLILTLSITQILRLVERKLDGQNNYIPYANQDQVTHIKK